MTLKTAAIPSIQPPQPLGADISELWALDPSVTFLNHGCFGARPKSVLEAQLSYRSAYEAKPVEWLDRRRGELINHAKESLGSFIGMSPENFGFVTNATNGINAVLRSLTFKQGDELLTTNHVYNGIRQTMKYLASRCNATATEIDIPLPLSSPEVIVEAIRNAISKRTRILVIDHVSSPTAIRFPVEEILQLCAENDIDVLVDGAHAPGMIDLNVEDLQPAYYSGNLHKWVCAPSGAGFLWVRPDKQEDIHPTTISHFLNEGLAEEFEWQGTRDITPWLCVRDSIEFFEQLGWENIRRHNHKLATWAHFKLSTMWGVDPSSPIDGSMLGSMATLPLPNQQGFQERYVSHDRLMDRLYQDFQIEVPVIPWRNQWWIRVSCQIYNSSNQYDRLGETVLTLADE